MNRAQSEEYADEVQTEKMDNMTEMEAEARHFLLDKRGVPGRRHWFDTSLPDVEGRFDPETGCFFYQDADGYYGHVIAFKIPLGTPKWALCGPDSILGEIILSD